MPRPFSWIILREHSAGAASHFLGTPENAFGLSGIQGVNASVERTAGMEILEYVPFRVGCV